jgi:agmatine deiminase
MESSSYLQPAEWGPHRACWTAWPSHAELWEDNLPKAQAEFAAMARGISEGRGAETLEVLVPNARAQAAAEAALSGLRVRLHRIPFGDIWLRDTAPIFVYGTHGIERRLTAARFRFNSWGNKYDLPHDPEVSANVAQAWGGPAAEFPFVLEGGSVDPDGEGTLLTTRQCLLNENRNPGLSQAQIERELRISLGAKKVLWLGDGLINDHTDGHIDTIARFVAPGRVVCMEARTAQDPNREVLEKIASDLAEMTDVAGRRLDVIRIPSPGEILSEDGDIMPASYVNFYIANSSVVVPTYGSRFDQEAVEAIARLFPGRRTMGLSARAILSGGGAFHCITQQEPGNPQS